MKQTTYTCNLCGITTHLPSDFIGFLKTEDGGIVKHLAAASELHLCITCIETIHMETIIQKK